MNDVLLYPIRPVYAFDTWELRNDPSTWKYAEPDAPLPATLESETKFYTEMETCKRNRMYAIVWFGDMIGAITFKNIGGGTCALGYYILRKELRGRGYATSALQQALYIGFEKMNLDMICIYANPENIPSYKMAINAGFYRAGISFIAPKVERLEMTKTIWKKKRKNI